MDRRQIAARALQFPLTILWLEGVIRLTCVGALAGRGLAYTLLFGLSGGLACGVLACLWGPRGNRRAAFFLTGLLTVWYMAQAAYFRVFKTFLTLDTVTLARSAMTDYWPVALSGILGALPILALLAVPLLLLCLWERRGRRKGRRERSTRPSCFAHTPRALAACLLVGAAVVQLTAVLAVAADDRGIQSPSELYRGPVEPELSVSHFGVLTTLRLDAQQLLAGELPELELEPPVGWPAAPMPVRPELLAWPEPPSESRKPAYAPNVLDIDFAGLLAEETDPAVAELHQYFSQRPPTLKNEYTGRFAGKNLLFITAEGFWKYAVNETYTPTLWKLAHEGFVFKNFYTPLWWKSTTDGEYTVCTSLIPTSARRSFKASAGNDMPFCMGWMLRDRGYPTAAYHDHTWTYYDRNLSHPNMGYDFYALGHWLEVTESWPESDLEMMQRTIPKALAGEKPFHNYYMTVSGHMNYNFTGNAMSIKHQAEVAELDMSEEAAAYLACNMELDQALAYTLEELKKAGELENTVICLSGDHYPYGMDPATWDEFYGGHMDTDFEVYHSTLILWSGDMTEPVVIEKPCESLDILPTLLNLFGLEYDSRLLAGRDILADEPGLVIFYNRSFLTDLGRYNARTDTFAPNEGAAVPDGYAVEVYQQVRDLFAYSVAVLDEDYYSRLDLYPGRARVSRSDMGGM